MARAARRLQLVQRVLAESVVLDGVQVWLDSDFVDDGRVTPGLSE